MNTTRWMPNLLILLLFFTAGLSSFHAPQHTAITSHDRHHAVVLAPDFASYLSTPQHVDDTISLKLLENCSECLLFGVVVMPSDALVAFASASTSHLLMLQPLNFKPPSLRFYSSRAPPIFLV